MPLGVGRPSRQLSGAWFLQGRWQVSVASLGATLLTADARAAPAPSLHCPVEVLAP